MNLTKMKDTTFLDLNKNINNFFILNIGIYGKKFADIVFKM